MTRFAFALLPALLLAACGTEEPPETVQETPLEAAAVPDSVAGTYALYAVDGAPLPRDSPYRGPLCHAGGVKCLARCGNIVLFHGVPAIPEALGQSIHDALHADHSQPSNHANRSA